MTDTTRMQMWSLLTQLYGAIAGELRSTFPDVRVLSDHWDNETVPFFGAGQFIVGDREVDVCFQVVSKSGQVVASGDICTESGFVLRDIMEQTLDSSAVDGSALLRCVEKFCSSSRNEVPVIVGALNEQ